MHNFLQVACREMGLTGGTVPYAEVCGACAASHSITPHDRGQLILLDEVSCTGSEARLIDCGNDGWGVHKCCMQESVVIRCDP